MSASDLNTVHGGRGNDNLKGGNSIDFLYGDEGDDRLHGNDNDDYLYGGSGSDTIFNDKGDDTVDGGSGVDIINLGTGVDIISGGSGTDIFTMSSRVGLGESTGQDVFTDFEQGEKLIFDLANKVSSTDISDVLAAFASGDQTNKWKVSKGYIITDNATNDESKQDTYIHYGTYGQSDFYIRFIFEDLDFDLTGSNFEIV